MSAAFPPPSGMPARPVAQPAGVPVTPPPGWYPDPGGAGLRWFDGYAWGPAWAPEAERPPHPTLRLSDAAWAVVILAASLVVGKLITGVVADLDAPIFLEAVIAGVIGYGPSVAWCAYVLRREGGGLGRVFGFRWRWSDLGWGPLTYIAAIAVEICLVLAVRVLDIPIESNVRETTDADRTAGYVAGLVLTAVIMAPLVEELVFRAVVLRGLASRLGVIGAVAVQSVLFGCAHVDPSRGWGNLGLAITLGAVGAAFGVAAVLTRRIGTTIIAHAIFNGVVLALVLSGALDDLDSELGLLLRR